jgi:hypothetical protein
VAAFGRLQAEHPPTEARAELVSAHAAAVDAREAVSRALEALPPDESSRILVSIFVAAGRMLHEIDPDNGAHTGAVPPAAS